MDKQAFSEAWGKKATQTFSQAVIDSLSIQEKRLYKKIVELGPANLPQAERQEVCLSSIILTL